MLTTEMVIFKPSESSKGKAIVNKLKDPTLGFQHLHSIF